jgi:hypothetical protein
MTTAVTYDEFLAELKTKHNTTVKDAISRLYELLKAEDPNLSKDDMYERIMKDCLEIWRKETIQKFMPDELKDPERQESGRTGRKKQELTVTNNGSVAGINPANSSDLSGEDKKGIADEQVKKSRRPNFEEEKKMLYESNHNCSNSDIHFTSVDAKREARIEELQLENGRLKEQLQEQKQQIGELIKSVNIAASLKKDDKTTTAVKESIEYKSLLTELEVLRVERDDLKQIATMQMKANPSQTFQSAANYKPSPANTNANTDTREIEFPAKLLSKFFMASNAAKQTMYLEIDPNNKVVGWESDAKRIAAKATA